MASHHSSTTAAATNSHSHNTPPRTVELPPPAWGSPAHLAARRAEKEWTQHLRAHASADAAQRKVGKHARYVDTVDVVVRYTLPPDWSLVVDGQSVGTIREGDAIWELPESDEVLVVVLKASSQPFFQRTGEFSKVRCVIICQLSLLNFLVQTSSAFKTPPLAKPTPKAVPEPVATVPSVPQEIPAPTIAPPPPSVPTEAPKPNNTVQPRRTFLPIAILSNMFHRIGGMLLWLIPSPLRARLNAWWSPVLRAPPPGYGELRPRTL